MRFVLMNDDVKTTLKKYISEKNLSSEQESLICDFAASLLDISKENLMIFLKK